MDTFDGFPAGELHFTSIPDLFFARLLPQIDDLAELKVTLHIIWRRQRGGRQVISRAELLADETLIHGLSFTGDDPVQMLDEALRRAVARRALLYVRVEDEQGTHDLYVVNSEGGRLALEKVMAGEFGVVATSGAEMAPPAERPNIFELYEANIGLLSPILVDELKDAELTYPASWIEDAIKIAAQNNVRKWSYIRAILERMATAGRDDELATGTTEGKKRWYTEDEFERFFQR
ncbi:MAG: DnaD domain-containing protein [Anaerolineae bacterium]